MPNIYGHSWWGVAAVVLNWPWIGLCLFEVRIAIEGKSPFEWQIPLLIWIPSFFVVPICCAVAYDCEMSYPSIIRAKGLVAFAGLLLLSYPVVLVCLRATGRL